MVFRPYPQLIPQFFNTDEFGPPPAVTRGSSWPWLDHLASGLFEQAYWRPIRTRFRYACPTSWVRLACPNNSPDHYAKGTPSPACAGSDCCVSCRFQVLFHSPSGVLFTFPSRYLCTIGFRLVFSLGGWSPQIPIGFHVPDGTRVSFPVHTPRI